MPTPTKPISGHYSIGNTTPQPEGQGLAVAARTRHLGAIETLARVRKLGITLQVNVNLPGAQQVNVQG